jgi:dipeptidyl-peptidase 4
VNSHFRRFLSAGLLALLIHPMSAMAQGTLADYQRAEKYLPGNIRHLVLPADVSPHWIEKTSRFWYREDSAEGTRFILVDAEKNTASPAFDQERLANGLAKVTGHSYNATDLPFEEFEYANDGNSIRFEIDDSKWTCSLTEYKCTKATEESENPFEEVSPDMKWAAYVQDHNLYVRDTSTGTIVQLTHDGVRGWDYATPIPMLGQLIAQGKEDYRPYPAVFWSPDSSKLVTYRIDSRNAGKFSSIQFVPPNQLRPEEYTYVYPLPGEALPKAEPIIFDILAETRTEVKTAPLDIQFVGGPHFEWFPDSKHFYYESAQRGYKELELREVDATTGEQRVMLSERAKTYVDPGETTFRFNHDGDEILWTSEEDGWNHIYLYNGKTGQLENQVTKGQWVVRRINYVDQAARQVYFLAGGVDKNQDPYFTHLYRINFDGTGMTPLTPEDANHTVDFSPDGKYFVDNYSRVDFPGESVLRRADDGSVIRVLEKADDSALLKLGWKYPIPFKGKALDGVTDLYGLIWRPSNFDPSKKYPIIEQVYTGPQGFFVPKTFGSALRLQSMAELGFVVVMVDGRGTTGRSRAFHEFSYHNLGGAFADHVAMIKQMAARYPYMDLTRVGIYGTSAGGYGSTHAILMYPDFYKVCVSISGDHDARLDKAWWNELYQGYPVGNDYAEQSNEALASRLQGHLLLEHGDIDDNVNPVETMRLVDALMSANKNFDMLLVPNMSHGETGPHAMYVVRRRWDYFVRYLLGVTPPNNFVIHEERVQYPGRR